MLLAMGTIGPMAFDTTTAVHRSDVGLCQGHPDAQKACHLRSVGSNLLSRGLLDNLQATRY